MKIETQFILKIKRAFDVRFSKPFIGFVVVSLLMCSLYFVRFAMPMYTKICPVCQKEFTKEGWKGYVPTCCSAKCGGVLKRGVKLPLSHGRRVKEAHRKRVKFFPEKEAARIAKGIETRKRNEYKHTEQTKQKISKANRGKKRSKECREIQSRRMKGVCMRPAGWKHTSEARKKISLAGLGRKATQESKNKISKALKGRKNPNKGAPGKIKSPEHCKNISLAKTGKTVASGDVKPCSPEACENLRNAHIARVEKQVFHGEPLMPCVGNKERGFLAVLQSSSQVIISKQHKVAGYFLDGYVKELNIAIEFDEQYVHSNCKQLKKDLIKEVAIIEKLECKFFRISDKRWLDEPEYVILEFLAVIKRRRSDAIPTYTS